MKMFLLRMFGFTFPIRDWLQIHYINFEVVCCNFLNGFISLLFCLSYKPILIAYISTFIPLILLVLLYLYKGNCVAVTKNKKKCQIVVRTLSCETCLQSILSLIINWLFIF